MLLYYFLISIHKKSLGELLGLYYFILPPRQRNVLASSPCNYGITDVLYISKRLESLEMQLQVTWYLTKSGLCLFWLSLVFYIPTVPYASIKLV